MRRRSCISVTGINSHRLQFKEVSGCRTCDGAKVTSDAKEDTISLIFFLKNSLKLNSYFVIHNKVWRPRTKFSLLFWIFLLFLYKFYSNKHSKTFKNKKQSITSDYATLISVHWFQSCSTDFSRAPLISVYWYQSCSHWLQWTEISGAWLKYDWSQWSMTDISGLK